MKALVTGATGFVGTHLVQALRRRRWGVRCLVRAGSTPAVLEKTGAELRFGDVRDRTSLNGVAEGVDVVFHLAAVGDVNAVSRRHLERYRATNVVGTRNLLDECADEELKKFVHFSSVAAMGEPKRKGTVSERDTCMPKTPYELSKRESELVALDFWRRRKVPVTILRPSMICGRAGGEAGKIEASVGMRLVPILGDGNSRIHAVHVGDVVDAAILAAKRGRNGSTYIISGASVKWNDLVDSIASKRGIGIRKVHIPVGLAMPCVSAQEKILSALGITPLFSSERVRRLANNYVLDSSKAKKKLGFDPRRTKREYGMRVGSG